MKININFTIDVNKSEWAEEYSIDVRDVRNDVKAYFSAESIIPDHLKGFVSESK